MQLSKQEEILKEKQEKLELVKDTVGFLKRRRFFQRAEALADVLDGAQEIARVLETEALLTGQPYSSAEYVIETEQNGDAQTFTIRKRGAR